MTRNPGAKTRHVLYEKYSPVKSEFYFNSCVMDDVEMIKVGSNKQYYIKENKIFICLEFFVQVIGYPISHCRMTMSIKFYNSFYFNTYRHRLNHLINMPHFKQYSDKYGLCWFGTFNIIPEEDSKILKASHPNLEIRIW
jgi:hypothetical protein